jgi:molecular chaperone GrpE
MYKGEDAVSGDKEESTEQNNDESTVEEMLVGVEEAVSEAAADEATQSTPATAEDFAEAMADARDQVLRAQAEAQNTRRRAEKDVESARKYALERFCSELLPVVDNLERALGAADTEHELIKPIAEGIDLTLKSFVAALEKFQLVQIDPTGEPFDPQFHQAITMVPNPDMEPNTVMDTMQKGFTLNGRLVRPAMVIVSRAPD